MASNHLHVYLHKVIVVLKATKAEFLMNYADRVDEDLVESNQSFIFDERRSILHPEKARMQIFEEVSQTAHF